MLRFGNALTMVPWADFMLRPTARTNIGFFQSHFTRHTYEHPVVDPQVPRFRQNADAAGG